MAILFFLLGGSRDCQIRKAIEPWNYAKTNMISWNNATLQIARASLERTCMVLRHPVEVWRSNKQSALGRTDQNHITYINVRKDGRERKSKHFKRGDGLNIAVSRITITMGQGFWMMQAPDPFALYNIIYSFLASMFGVRRHPHASWLQQIDHHCWGFRMGWVSARGIACRWLQEYCCTMDAVICCMSTCSHTQRDLFGVSPEPR